MITTYMFNKVNQTMIISLSQQTLTILESFFAKYNAIIGKPTFIITCNKITVQLFYYRPKFNLTDKNIAALRNSLRKYSDRVVRLQVIRINHMTLDSSILAQYLTTNGIKYSFNRMFDIIKNNIPIVRSYGSLSNFDSECNIKENPVTHITGIKVKLSGRLITQRSKPRQTVQSRRMGSSAKSLYGIVDFSQYTSKNKLGRLTIKI